MGIHYGHMSANNRFAVDGANAPPLNHHILARNTTISPQLG